MYVRMGRGDVASDIVAGLREGDTSGDVAAAEKRSNYGEAGATGGGGGGLTEGGALVRAVSAD